MKTGCGLTDHCKFNEICSETDSGQITCSPPPKRPWNECADPNLETRVPTKMITPFLFASSSYKGLYSSHDATAWDYRHWVPFVAGHTTNYNTYWSSASKREIAYIGFQTPVCRPLAISYIFFKTYYKQRAEDFTLYGRPCRTKGLKSAERKNRFNFAFRLTYWNVFERQNCEMEEVPMIPGYNLNDRNYHKFRITSPKYFHSYVIRFNRPDTYSTESMGVFLH